MDKATLNSYGQPLCLTMCFCSSEDDAHPCSNLQTQIRSASGWQSSKHCEYPQEMGFFFDGQVNLNVIRILSHESKISSCIDVFIADASSEELQKGTCIPYEEALFTRLGHVRLTPNDKFTARELKTVGIKKSCVYIKLLFSRPYTNSYNLFNQVGIIGIAAHGNVLRSVSAGSSIEMEIPIAAVSEVGLDEMVPSLLDESVDVLPSDFENSVSNAEIVARLKELDRLKMKAIKEEDYDLAAALKGQIEEVKKAGAEIDELEKEKQFNEWISNDVNYAIYNSPSFSRLRGDKKVNPMSKSWADFYAEFDPDAPESRNLPWYHKEFNYDRRYKWDERCMRMKRWVQSGTIDGKNSFFDSVIAEWEQYVNRPERFRAPDNAERRYGAPRMVQLYRSFNRLMDVALVNQIRQFVQHSNSSLEALSGEEVAKVLEEIDFSEFTFSVPVLIYPDGAEQPKLALDGSVASP